MGIGSEISVKIWGSPTPSYLRASGLDGMKHPRPLITFCMAVLCVPSQQRAFCRLNCKTPECGQASWQPRVVAGGWLLACVTQSIDRLFTICCHAPQNQWAHNLDINAESGAHCALRGCVLSLRPRNTPLPDCTCHTGLWQPVPWGHVIPEQTQEPELHHGCGLRQWVHLSGISFLGLLPPLPWHLGPALRTPPFCCSCLTSGEQWALPCLSTPSG